MANDKDHLHGINRRHEVVFGVVLASVLIIMAVIERQPDSENHQIVTSDHSVMPEVVIDKPNAATQFDNHIDESRKNLVSLLETQQIQGNHHAVSLIDAGQLINWVKAAQFSKAHHYLIEKAANAVDSSDHQQLGQIMQLLARVSASQGDLASAEVYLFEALEIFKQLNNQQALADTNILIGQMYARRRQIAQMAGWAYGDLLMARFFLSKGNYYQAKDTLDASIKDNLKLGRTGAVASSYKTMARYYRAIHDTTGEQNALIEAGRYFAHSGQSYQANQIVQQLYRDQAPLDLIQSLEQQIESRLSMYESQINIVRQARDYMQLYNLYKSKGEHGRAWQFRIKASEILSRTDKRDMYFRMPDVMAVLYDSNYNLVKASDFYKQASDYYLSQNQVHSHQRAQKLMSNLN